MIFLLCVAGKNLCTRTDGNDDQLFVNSISTARPSLDADNEGIVPSQKRYSCKVFLFFFLRAVKVLVMHIFISFLMSMSEFMVVLNLFPFP